MSVRRASLLATACLLSAAVSVRAQVQAPAPAQLQQQPQPRPTHRPVRGRAPARPLHSRPAPPAAGGVIQSIRIEGNQRIENGTIESYMSVATGDPFDPDRIDRSLKTLYATGLFHDVALRRDGNVLVVHVAENPIVNRIAFEGNHAVNDDQLRAELRLRPRAVFTPELAQADRQRLLDLYAKRGHYAATVEPKIIRLGQNRVDVVFEINDGPSNYVSRITFVGNHAFGEERLSEVINTREERWWRFLSNSDQYDPERANFDKELLRRFYLKNGFIDFDVQSTNAELSPDHKSFFLTFVVHEGERFRVGKVSVESHLHNVSGASLQQFVQIGAGDTYDGDAVERSSQAIQDAVQSQGFAFVTVHPRIARNAAAHTVDLSFDVAQGPRVYVERIDITGNTRTEDKVIRREFQFAEGDAFDAAAVRRTRQRLQDLGYFNSVNISPSPGSSPDRAVVNTTVDEKSTGELTLGGGYSSDAGALVNAGLREKNLVGTGIDASVNGVLAQRESSIDLSVTDPYFLDRNLVTGFDLFRVDNNNEDIAEYSERRTGFTLRLGYAFSDHLSQAWSYSLVDRDVYDVQSGASLYVLDQTGGSILSEVGQTLTLDYRDSRVDPHTGFVTRLGTDVAGLGGNAHYVRAKVDSTYYVPLDYFTGDSDWGIAVSGSAGYLFTLGEQPKIIDNFFLGGDNLRGFESGGAGPHSVPTDAYPSADAIGGRFIWTQSTELRFPLPINPDLGLTGRAFVDVGALSVAPTSILGQPIYENSSPRVGAGVGVSWKTPFGLINIDVADPVVKYRYDQTQVFRFGFGTRF